jgi:hypothetical protein
VLQAYLVDHDHFVFPVAFYRRGWGRPPSETRSEEEALTLIPESRRPPRSEASDARAPYNRWMADDDHVTDVDTLRPNKSDRCEPMRWMVIDLCSWGLSGSLVFGPSSTKQPSSSFHSHTHTHSPPLPVNIYDLCLATHNTSSCFASHRLVSIARSFDKSPHVRPRTLHTTPTTTYVTCLSSPPPPTYHYQTLEHSSSSPC